MAGLGRIKLTQLEVMKKVAGHFNLNDYRYYHQVTEPMFEEMYHDFTDYREDVTVIEFMWIYICYFHTLRRPDHTKERQLVMEWGMNLMKKDYQKGYKYY